MVRKIKSETAKIDSETAKIKLEIKKLNETGFLNWLKGLNYLQLIIGALIGGGLFYTFLYDYLQPIIYHKVEIQQLKTEILSYKTQIDANKNLLERTKLETDNQSLNKAIADLSKKNNELSTSQIELNTNLVKSKNRFIDLNSKYKELLELKSLSDAERERLQELTATNNKQIITLSKDIEKLEEEKNLTEKRKNDLILLSISGQWDIYSNNGELIKSLYFYQIGDEWRATTIKFSFPLDNKTKSIFLTGLDMMDIISPPLKIVEDKIHFGVSIDLDKELVVEKYEMMLVSKDEMKGIRYMNNKNEEKIVLKRVSKENAFHFMRLFPEIKSQ